MKTTKNITTTTETAGIPRIPTRIKQVPPLTVDPIDETVRREVAARLEALGEQLAGVHRIAAEAYLSQGMHEEALAHLEAAARFAPREIEYQNQLGVVRYFQEDDAGAIAAFERVIDLAPDNHDARFNLGMVLYGTGARVEAEEAFRIALELDPNEAETWNNRGVCLFELGRIGDARACFERALQIDPENQDARENLASAEGR